MRKQKAGHTAGRIWELREGSEAEARGKEQADSPTPGLFLILCLALKKGLGEGRVEGQVSRMLQYYLVHSSLKKKILSALCLTSNTVDFGTLFKKPIKDIQAIKGGGIKRDWNIWIEMGVIWHNLSKFKTHILHTLWSSNFTSRNLTFKYNHVSMQRKVPSKPLSLQLCFVIAKTWKQSKRPSRRDWLNKWWHYGILHRL